LSSIAGLLTPAGGEIRVGDIDVLGLRGAQRAAYRRETVGVIFQAFNLIPSLSALGNVMVPLRLSGRSRSAARARALELLELVGLAERTGHRPGRLSGGQQQRVAIARALAHDPPVVVADEPTAHLDGIQVEAVLRLIREIAAAGRLVVVATHDDRITRIADQVIDLVKHSVQVRAGRAPSTSTPALSSSGRATRATTSTSSSTVGWRSTENARTAPRNRSATSGPVDISASSARCSTCRAARRCAALDTQLTALGIGDFRERYSSSVR
jgi:ABC-type lipoprotein export system ATPase subunit